MIGCLTLIVCCQLPGELRVAAVGLPVPGPMAGMVLLFLGVVVRGRLPDGLGRVPLDNLSPLFCPRRPSMSPAKVRLTAPGPRSRQAMSRLLRYPSGTGRSAL